MNNKPHIFLDIDGVMVVGRLLYSNRTHPKYDGSPFDKKCVAILNEIIEKVNPNIILSSDWKDYFNINELSEIFELNGINTKVTDITPIHWGDYYTRLSELERCRASEIMHYVIKNKLTNYVVIDDLNLEKLMPEGTFIFTSRVNEGIKQSETKNKILNILNS